MDKTAMKHLLFDQYENALAQQRALFETNTAALYQALPKLKGLLFLIYFCGLGVHMTEKVSVWIKEAGEGCIRKGYNQLGEALKKHAQQEKGHEQLMKRDTFSLTRFIHNKYGIIIDAGAILSQPMTTGVLQYRQLHEACIHSKSPYGQIAIEYEIEKISISYGPRFITYCLLEHGILLLRCLSFVRSHVSLDIFHTKENKLMLSHFLNDFPETLPHLIDYGSQALNCYEAYLNDCRELAESHFAKITF